MKRGGVLGGRGEGLERMDKKEEKRRTLKIE